MILSLRLTFMCELSIEGLLYILYTVREWSYHKKMTFMIYYYYYYYYYYFILLLFYYLFYYFIIIIIIFFFFFFFFCNVNIFFTYYSGFSDLVREI